MLQDSTIANGKLVPVIRRKIGKNMNNINTIRKITEKIQPLKLSSFQRRYQNLPQ